MMMLILVCLFIGIWSYYDAHFCLVHAQRDIIRFGDVPAEDEADDDIQDEHVMGIDAEEEEEDGMEEGVVYDIGSRGDDVDHYYDEDDVQVATSKRETRGGWGKTKQIYYEHQRKQPTEQTEEGWQYVIGCLKTKIKLRKR